MKISRKYKRLTVSLILISLIISSLLLIRIFQIERSSKRLTEDQIELCKIKYGFLNVDEWKIVLSEVLAKKLNDFKIDHTNKNELRVAIHDFLYESIDKFEENYYDEKEETFTGWIQAGVASASGLFSSLKDEIPVITEDIIALMDDPETKEKIKLYFIELLDNYTNQTFSAVDYTLHDQIIEEYGFSSRMDTVDSLKQRINDLDLESLPYIIILMCILLIAGLYIILGKSISPLEFLLLSIQNLFILVSGLTLAMISIDARITSISMTFLGESITFNDQVLYYKSKSILEVVQLMVTQGKIDLFLVGILIFAFSVLFPLFKQIAQYILIMAPKYKENKILRILTFHIGKWSMADVMVVAIFMAYIGFSGIISEQLNQLGKASQQVEIITTNHSSIETGFYMFTAFVILSNLISNKINQKLKKKTE